MKKIQVLGSGCAKCNKLFEAADAAAKSLGLPYEITKVTDITEILNFGVMMTPALVVDGVVKCSGRIPGETELKNWIA